MSTAIDPFSPVWQSSPQFWSDRDVFRRWQDAMLALHELTHRVNDQGEVEEIRFTEDEERRLHALLNLGIAASELVMRTLGNEIEKLRKQLDEMQQATVMQADELMEITRALVPGATAEDRLEN